MKWIDLPPVWLLFALILSYWIGQSGLFSLGLTHGIWRVCSVLLIGAGLVLMALAVLEMRRHKTTVIPHLEAAHLVQSGVFKHTRNPIYLGDVLVLMGCIIWWDALIALPLVALLIVILQTRFIHPEEDRLRAKFAAEFDDYCTTTRRWI